MINYVKIAILFFVTNSALVNSQTPNRLDGIVTVNALIGNDINIDGLGQGYWNYNAMVVNNITKRPVTGSNPARNYVANNILRDATTLPAQPSPIVPLYQSFEENKTQY